MSEYPKIDEKIQITIFCGPKKKGLKSALKTQCDHLGGLTYNGYNSNSANYTHRVKCKLCGKRFGTDVGVYDLLKYQEKIKKIAYEIFILKFNLKGIAIRWGIRPEMLSRFKKTLVSQIYEQNHQIIETHHKSLPRGIILGDETFMGKRGNSHSEVVFINDNFETLSTGSVQSGFLKRSILDTFDKIPGECSEKVKILMSDGEPGYKAIPLRIGGKTIHLIQYHSQNRLGEVSIEKYEKIGPHRFHYIIHTHWKAFAQGKCELNFKWKIKFIKGNVYKKIGRPKKSVLPKNINQKWRQKVADYQNGKMKRAGSATVFVNTKSDKISKRKGSTNWMIRMMQPLYNKFKGKCMTTSLIESKHHQIKSINGDRKQQDQKYNHQLFALSCYIVENGHLPHVNLQGRPLYKYLMKVAIPRELRYITINSGVKTIQKTLPTY